MTTPDEPRLRCRRCGAIVLAIEWEKHRADTTECRPGIGSERLKADGLLPLRWATARAGHVTYLERFGIEVTTAATAWRSIGGGDLEQTWAPAWAVALLEAPLNSNERDVAMALVSQNEERQRAVVTAFWLGGGDGVAMLAREWI